MNTGALANVKQLAVELHLSYVPNHLSFFLKLIEMLQDLYKLNFRIISHEVNMVMGPGADGRYNFLEVVFMKDDVWI